MMLIERCDRVCSHVGTCGDCTAAPDIERFVCIVRTRSGYIAPFRVENHRNSGKMSLKQIEHIGKCQRSIECALSRVVQCMVVPDIRFERCRRERSFDHRLKEGGEKRSKIFPYHPGSHWQHVPLGIESHTCAVSCLVCTRSQLFSISSHASLLHSWGQPVCKTPSERIESPRTKQSCCLLINIPRRSGCGNHRIVIEEGNQTARWIQRIE